VAFEDAWTRLLRIDQTNDGLSMNSPSAFAAGFPNPTNAHKSTLLSDAIGGRTFRRSLALRA